MNYSQQMKKRMETSQRFPWYDKFIIDGGRNKWEHLPLLTEDILEQTYYRFPPPYGVEVYRTSGTSTGKRKCIYYNKTDAKHYIDRKSRLFRSWLKNSDCTTVLADVGTGHAAATASAVFSQTGYTVHTISHDRPLREHIHMLETYRPDVLYTMPSLLDRITAATDQPQRYRLRKIILVGEIASRQWQRKIADQYGLSPHDVLDTYGSIEIGTIAYYSHLHDRYVLVEDLYGETAELAEIGLEGKLQADESILVLTSWSRQSFPAIRFVTYDVVRQFRTMEIDGIPRQTFHSIVKRVGAELKHGEKISVYDVEEVVFQQLDRANVYVQMKDNVLTVTIVSKQWRDGLIPAIRLGIERRIPEIGEMIAAGMLSRIEVRGMTDIREIGEKMQSIKARKIFRS